MKQALYFKVASQKRRHINEASSLL